MTGDDCCWAPDSRRPMRTRRFGRAGHVLVLGVAITALTGCAGTPQGGAPVPTRPAHQVAAAVAASPPGSCHYRGGLPDPVCTPGGDPDPRVSQATIRTTICVPGWSASVRPPVSVTEPIKRERMRAYGVNAPLSTVELDHALPVSLGGLTTVQNLWPQSWDGPEGAHVKDRLELRVRYLVCQGKLPLAQAQHAITTDLVTAYRTYVGPIS